MAGSKDFVKNLTDPRLIKLKGGLFLFAGIVAAALLIFENPTLRTAALLVITSWCFCRAYYFAFYVIEHYVDPNFRFSGLGSALRHLLRKSGKTPES